jgi:hypothetical protein
MWQLCWFDIISRIFLQHDSFACGVVSLAAPLADFSQQRRRADELKAVDVFIHHSLLEQQTEGLPSFSFGSSKGKSQVFVNQQTI